ncbi:uncharacterized protein ColSpa_05448 [Colletotrichum spaethianum]|uniref:Uncharacterized protein n=1 Tax=Colletotrichum spaethianum TaxID=700344 RepID=A0AA37LJL3_9PEZI|nr:uncharacterized protein ColSpa_05448 [Colletotrichum spaethianum]GKT45267.1 hypothetical protein ColSpa_05448 [Colletotrichum spaethianum]
MALLLDSELPARRFLRRGAVTELVDPSAVDPNLQGLQAEWPAEAPVPDWKRYNMAPRQRQLGGPHILAIPQARAHRGGRVRIGVWLSVSLAAIAGVVIMWAVIFNIVWLPRREGTEAIMVEIRDAEHVKDRKSWWETSWLVAGIVFRGIVAMWGGYRLFTRGSQCLFNSLPRGSSAQKLFNNEFLKTFTFLLGYTILPTATSALWTIVVPGGFCYPEHNILRFWPPHTRNDIKAVLEGWIELATLHIKVEASFSRMVKCKNTIGQVLVWMLGVGVWTTVEILYGPCRYFPLVWKSWFSVLGISLASWFLGNAEALFVKELKAVGSVHVEFVAYLVIFYVARWVDLQGYCTRPSCW